MSSDSRHKPSPTPSMLPSPPESPVLRGQQYPPYSPATALDLEANKAQHEEGSYYPPQQPLGASLPLSTPGVSTYGDHNSEADPLLLRTKLLADEEIDTLRKRVRQKKKGGGVSKAKKVGEFYDDQNDHIRALLKPLSKHAEDALESEASGRLPVKIAVYASLIANCCLAVLQIYAASTSLSLSFFATAIDSVFDPFANVALQWAHRKAVSADPLKYPSGGSRLETIGNIVYAFLMNAVSLILIVESIRTIATHNGEDDTNDFHIPATAAVGVAFLTKLCLFLYCFSIRKMSSQVQILWEDHRNDLAINGFGILTNAAGAKLAWFIDPMGAIIISVVIIGSWTRTAYTEFQCLAGRSADPDFLRLVVYKAMTFSDAIVAIDSCKAYHAGPDYVVEVDIVMPSDTPLSLAHDISQDLQDQLESLPRVDRAFVHVDHEVSHQPEHRKVR